MCICMLVKIANGFLLCRLVVTWKYFLEAFVFIFYVRKDQAQEQYGWKLRFHSNKQKNDYLHW